MFVKVMSPELINPLCRSCLGNECITALLNYNPFLSKKQVAELGEVLKTLSRYNPSLSDERVNSLENKLLPQPINNLTVASRIEVNGVLTDLRDYFGFDLRWVPVINSSRTRGSTRLVKKEGFLIEVPTYTSKQMSRGQRRGLFKNYLRIVRATLHDKPSSYVDGLDNLLHPSRGLKEEAVLRVLTEEEPKPLNPFLSKYVKECSEEVRAYQQIFSSHGFDVFTAQTLSLKLLSRLRHDQIFYKEL